MRSVAGRYFAMLRSVVGQVTFRNGLKRVTDAFFLYIDTDLASFIDLNLKNAIYGFKI